MKKKMLVAVVLVVIVAVVGVFFWWRNAAGAKEDEAFLAWIRPFYQEEQENYTFQDAQGADITQKVMEDTQDGEGRRGPGAENRRICSNYRSRRPLGLFHSGRHGVL